MGLHVLVLTRVVVGFCAWWPPRFQADIAPRIARRRNAGWARSASATRRPLSAWPYATETPTAEANINAGVVLVVLAAMSILEAAELTPHAMPWGIV